MTDKIGRDAFLYMEPRSSDDKSDFAQCGSCRMFVPESYLEGKEGLCILHGSNVNIDEDDTCGFYAPWPEGKPNEEVIQDHATELLENITGSVTAEESGLVDRQVQCHRCKFEKNDATICGLYEMLNKQRDVFDLDANIEPHACCNAQMPKGKTKESDTKDLRDVIIMAVRGKDAA